MAQRLDSSMPGSRGRPVIVSILFVSLFACSLATSSSQQQQQQQWSPRQSQAGWRRAAPEPEPGLFDRYFEPLYERPAAVYAAAPQQQLQQQVDNSGDSATDDEQFLRQLKVAAEYLDEKLAARQREQQQRALLAKLGRFVDSSPSSSSAAGQGPAYSLAAGYDPASRDDNVGVVVVAPSSVDSAPDLSESYSQVDSPNYRLLDDNTASPGRGANEQQLTYDNYKQLLQTLLAPDRAQPTQGDHEATAATAVKRNPPVGLGAQIDEQARGKLTTLVDNDDDDDEKGEGDASALNLITQAKNETKTTTGQPAASVFGKVVYKQNSTTTSGAQGASSSSLSSSSGGVFGRMYAQLSRYLPFMSQISILRNGQPTNETKIILATGGLADKAPANREVQGDKGQLAHKKTISGAPLVAAPKRDSDAESSGHEATANEPLHARPGVSVSLAHTGKLTQSLAGDDQDDDNKGQVDEEKDNQNGELDDKHLEVNVMSVVRQRDDDHDDDDKGQQVAAAGGAGAAKGANAKRRLMGGPDNQRDISELDMGQMMAPVIVKPPVAQYNHLIGQPTQNTDQPIAGPDQGVGSLLGKYIYAPTQHYYLSSVLPSTTGSGNHHYHHQLHAAAARHLLPGDQVFGSYADMPMKAAYAYQKDPSVIVNGPGPGPNSLIDKSNDLYFLIMVGAFCVMAMAVVLAAGAFAYRVQQSRKLSQETDYPTYGVVGPNNMSASGKCGASAFSMGGYFMGPQGGGGGGGSASSKSGSAKHLADLYGHPVHGPVAASGRNANGGSDSGLNSLGRSSHHSAGHAPATTTKRAASSSASSLNNGAADNQPGGGRNAPASFMSAAASQDAARMYHYQHQKQQMIISDRNSTAGGRHTSASDLDSEEENDDGSYTVYECPGLASAHEMEIKNPLFNDDQTP